MKPVKGNIYRSSDDVESVIERMYEVVGRPLGMSYALALGVSESAIKNWRARSGVASKFLHEFAETHNVSIDWLLHGDQHRAGLHAAESEDEFSYEERALIASYRRCNEASRKIIRATSSALEQHKTCETKTKGRRK